MLTGVNRAVNNVLPSQQVSPARPYVFDIADKISVAQDLALRHNRCAHSRQLVRRSAHSTVRVSQCLRKRLDRHAEVRQHLQIFCGWASQGSEIVTHNDGIYAAE